MKDDVTRDRIEAVRFALGDRRDVHAVCDMAVRWLDVLPTLNQFARRLSVKDCARLIKAMDVKLVVYDRSLKP